MRDLTLKEAIHMRREAEAKIILILKDLARQTDAVDLSIDYKLSRGKSISDPDWRICDIEISIKLEI
jgi:hypothetical protein